jgi:tetratricopeptide (TPR) repeat protein
MLGAGREKPVAPALPVGESEDALLTAVRRARQQLQTHGLEAGIEAFEDVLDQVREEISYLYSKRASELRQEGRLDEAQATLERGLRYWPENTHIRQLLADIHASKARELARRGFYAQSKGHLRKSLELDPANLSARELAQELERVLGGRGKRPQGRRPGR